MDVFLIGVAPILMVVATLFAIGRWGDRDGPQWTEEEEDEFDDAEIAFWLSNGWDGEGPPPHGPTR